MAAQDCLLQILPKETPFTYLEIGVLRATNLVEVARLFPLAQITGVDSYIPYVDPAHGGYVISPELSKFNHERALKAISKSPDKDRIELIIEDSSVFAAKTPDAFYDVVFLDKGFSIDGQSQDIRDWYSKVKPGGIFCGHDAWTPDIWTGLLQGLASVGIHTPPPVIDREVWYLIKQ